MICSSARLRVGRSGMNGNSGSEHDSVVAASALQLAIRSAPQRAAICFAGCSLPLTAPEEA